MSISSPTSALLPAALAFVCAVAGTTLFARFAERFGLLDHPGGRKNHSAPVPLVGGIAIFVAVTAAGFVYRSYPNGLLAATLIVLAIGAVDDAADLRPRIRFAAQIVAAVVMVLIGGIELQTVGDLLGRGPIGLSIFALMLTVFAVVGVINSINMLDGLDGLAGSISFVALLWYAAVAHYSGLEDLFATALTTAAAVFGFLLFNARWPWQTRARVFLGDAGSMALGFILAWLAIDLTQGAGRSFPPICALWMVLLPLADCVSLMARRVAVRKSPFAADNRHIHHYLLARGFTIPQTWLLLAAISTMFGAIGFFGWRWRVPETYLFWAFFIMYFAYHFAMKRAWRALDDRRRIVESDDEDEAVRAS